MWKSRLSKHTCHFLRHVNKCRKLWPLKRQGQSLRSWVCVTFQTKIKPLICRVRSISNVLFKNILISFIIIQNDALCTLQSNQCSGDKSNTYECNIVVMYVALHTIWRKKNEMVPSFFFFFKYNVFGRLKFKKWRGRQHPNLERSIQQHEVFCNWWLLF